MRISKIDFAKIFVLFIVFALILSLLASGGLIYVFRDRIHIAMTSHSLIKEFEAGSADNMVQMLSAVSAEFTDILLLDTENKVIFSEKNFISKKDATLNLTKVNQGHRLYLTNEYQNDIYFKPVENNKKSEFLSIFRDENTHEEYCADFFYQSTFNRDGLYYLSCGVNPSGQKLYLIWSAVPIINGEFYLKCAVMLFALLFMCYWVLLALWIYSDAQKARLHGAVWGLLTLFSNLAGAILYLLFRSSLKVCFQCGALQSRQHLYCLYCGAKIGDCCEKCGTPMKNDSVYCTKCGTKH